MTNSKRILFIIGILAILVVLMVLLWRTPQRHSWLETYKEDSRDPFGTQVIFELLKSYFPGQMTKVIEDKLSEELPEKSSRPSNYVFIGEGLYLDSLDTETLLNYVSEGNTAFISSRTIPYDLMYYLYDEECISYYWDDYYSAIDTSQNLNFSHPDLRSANGFDYTFIFRNKTRPYRWQYIDSSYFCNEEYGFVELGRMNDTLINFARIKHGGRGLLFTHYPRRFFQYPAVGKNSPGLC
jgi:hypothetical protein